MICFSFPDNYQCNSKGVSMIQQSIHAMAGLHSKEFKSWDYGGKIIVRRKIIDLPQDVTGVKAGKCEVRWYGPDMLPILHL